MTASVVLRDIAGDLRALPRSSMITAAKAVKKIADDEARRAGSPLTKGRRRVKLRAFDDIRLIGEGHVRCRVQGVPVGPWVWVNTGTAPHQIPRTRKRPRKKGRYLGLPGHPVLSPPVVIHHPGTSGRGAWRRVQLRAAEVVPQIFRDDVHRVVS